MNIPLLLSSVSITLSLLHRKTMSSMLEADDTKKSVQFDSQDR